MTQESRPEQCWRVIGIAGNRSCPELETYTHCNNCPVFSQSGRRLMDAEPPAGYIEQWTTFLADARLRKNTRTISVLVFRLGSEWIAIETAFVVEVSGLRPSRTVAHRNNGTLRGIVNIRGNLLLQVDLFHLLKIDLAPAAVDASAAPRLIVIRNGAATWVFQVDEVLGVQRFSSAEVGSVPVTVAQQVAHVTKGLLTFGDRRVGFVDTDALFAQLRQAVG
jgi:chemotaxis-related protein WspD